MPDGLGHWVYHIFSLHQSKPNHLGHHIGPPADLPGFTAAETFSARPDATFESHAAKDESGKKWMSAGFQRFHQDYAMVI